MTNAINTNQMSLDGSTVQRKEQTYTVAELRELRRAAHRRSTCWNCHNEIEPMTGPFCSMDCEYEYNKCGF